MLFASVVGRSKAFISFLISVPVGVNDKTPVDDSSIVRLPSAREKLASVFTPFISTVNPLREPFPFGSVTIQRTTKSTY